MSLKIVLAVVAVAALTIGPAIIAGNYANRWGTPADLSGAAKRVQTFPREIGRWTSTKDGEPLAAEVCEELGLAGYVSRVYTNRDSGNVITLLLMVGQPGPLLRHPPNICYANRANEQVGKMTSFEAPKTTPPSSFNLLEYKPPSTITDERFLVAFSMATNAHWHVPNMPRLEYGGASVLYKVQLLMVENEGHNREKDTLVLQEFASGFCDAFDKPVANPEAPATPQKQESKNSPAATPATPAKNS